MRNFRPTSRQQNERLVERKQTDFSAGMFADGPASLVPPNGVRYLKNYKNRGNALESRSGCRLWGKWATNTACATLPLKEDPTTFAPITNVEYASYPESGTNYRNFALLYTTGQSKSVASNIKKIVCSKDAQYSLVITTDNTAYYSLDSGENYSSATLPSIGSDDIVDCDIDKTGQYQLIATSGGDVVLSTNYGQTWNTVHNQPTTSFAACTIASDDSSRMIIVDTTNVMIYSTDHGATWLTMEGTLPSTNPTCIDSSGDGNSFSIGYTNGYIYTFGGFVINSYKSFDTNTIGTLSGIACSEEMEYILASSNGGNIYGSEDQGISFTEKLYDTSWKTVCMSNDGFIQYATGTNIPLYISKDFGITWSILYASAEPRSSICCNSTGSIFYVKSTTDTIRIPLKTGYLTSKISIGDYFVHASGLREKVVFIDLPFNIKTIDKGTSYLSGNGSISTKHNGIFYHKNQNKVLLYLGTNFYMSTDQFMTSWTKLNCTSKDKPQNIKSTKINEYGKYAVVHTSTGKYLVDMSDSTIPYYRVNTQSPTNTLVNQPQTTATYVYRKRYTYTACTISGNNHRTRITSGAEILSETGSCKPNPYNKDYADVYSTTAVSAANKKTVSLFKVPTSENNTSILETRHTHFGVYNTLDIGKFGVSAITGKGNNTELYVWNTDIPIGKAYFGFIDASGLMTISQGKFETADEGNQIYSRDGKTLDIKEVLTPSTANVTQHGSGSFVNTPETGAAYDVPMAWGFGSSTVGELSQTGNTITVVGGTSSAYSPGTAIFLSNGIVEWCIPSTGYSKVTKSIELPNGTAFVLAPTQRVFTDNTPDTDLLPRISTYYLQSRFLNFIPNGNLGVVVNGFMFSASENDTFVYYQQLSEGRFIGQKHPLQYTKINDSITDIVEYNGTIIIKCKGSIVSIPTNTYRTEDIPSIGISTALIARQDIVDKSIGVFSTGASAPVENGKEIIITSEPAIRMFNGSSFSENYAENRIMGILRKLQTNYVVGFHPKIGLIFYCSDLNNTYSA